MDKALALDKITDAIGPILDELESSAYKDGENDAKAENEKAVAQARDEGYDEGYAAAKAEQETEE